jgi:DNA-binding cell septation regulator SpoVG
MTVSALNFKAFERGSMKGFFDLRYHGLTVKGCRLMQGNGGLWIALPQKEVEQDGERKWVDLMHLTPPEAEHVRKLAVADLQGQGHIERPAATTPKPKAKPAARLSQGRHRTPEGEDLSEHYTNGADDDIPF